VACPSQQVSSSTARAGDSAYTLPSITAPTSYGRRPASPMHPRRADHRFVSLKFLRVFSLQSAMRLCSSTDTLTSQYFRHRCRSLCSCTSVAMLHRWVMDDMRKPFIYTRIYASPIRTSSPPAAGSSSVSSSAGASV
jgi:hypothetical protein